MSSQQINVNHNASKRRFEATVDEHTGYVAYELEGNDIVLTQTLVPEEISGRGVARAVVKKALDYARENHLKVKPECSYAAEYIERHADEYGDLVS